MAEVKWTPGTATEEEDARCEMRDEIMFMICLSFCFHLFFIFVFVLFPFDLPLLSISFVIACMRVK